MYCVSCQAPVLREGESLPPPLSLGTAPAAAALSPPPFVPSPAAPKEATSSPVQGLQEGPKISIPRPEAILSTSFPSSPSLPITFSPPPVTPLTPQNTAVGVSPTPSNHPFLVPEHARANGVEGEGGRERGGGGGKAGGETVNRIVDTIFSAPACRTETDVAIAQVASTLSREKRRENASAAMGQRLLQGWVMGAESCPECLVPLMREGGRGGGVGRGQEEVWECVGCITRFSREEEEGRRATGREGGGEEEGEGGGGVKNEEEGNQTHQKAELEGKREEAVDVSAVIGQKLLQGWALLAGGCEGCGNPLMRDLQGEERCLACGGGGVAGSAEKREGGKKEEEEEEEVEEEEEGRTAVMDQSVKQDSPPSLPPSLPPAHPPSLPPSPSVPMQAALRAILEKMEEITSALKKTSVGKCDEMGRMAMALARLGEAAEVLERSVMRQEGKREQASPKRSRLG